jgi:hypothetical protein
MKVLPANPVKEEDQTFSRADIKTEPQQVKFAEGEKAVLDT